MRFPQTLYLLPFTVFALFQTSLTHADFQAGQDAYKRGDYSTAKKEWLPLAEQGYALAQVNLGVHYANGQGVRQDHVQAHMWFNLAATQEDEMAAKNRKLLAKKMTPE